MRILFAIGLGILPEQRINRWKMVSTLYGNLGKALNQLGHQTYFLVHPEAHNEDLPSASTWLMEDHSLVETVIERFQPDFCFCWNGSSPGDIVTASIMEEHGVKMVYSEQGWFPQKDTLYFDFKGCNGKCSTINKVLPVLNDGQRRQLIKARANYISEYIKSDHWDLENYAPIEPDLSKPIFVPLQDERDLNIIQDSPFKTMHAFVSHLAQSYPKQQLIIRPHPKYASPKLPEKANITLDNPKQPMFDTLSQCGLVMGINSTTLLESALLGYKVVSFGTSLATGTGLFSDSRDIDNPIKLKGLKHNVAKTESILYHLLCGKQFLREDLSNPNAVMKSLFFKELVKRMSWNVLNP